MKRSRGFPSPGPPLPVRCGPVAIALFSLLLMSATVPASRSPASATDTAPIRFRDVTEAANVSYTNISGEPAKDYIVSSTGSGAGWIDFDQDGRLDLYITNGAGVTRTDDGALRAEEGRPNVMYRNLDGRRFAEVAAGVGDRGWAGGCAVGDIDNDGFPDLYVTNMGRNRLFRNMGDGTFEILDDPSAQEEVWSASAAFADLDGDGWLDLYVTNYVDYAWEDPPPPECKFLGVDVFCGPLGLAPVSDDIFRNTRHGGFEPWPQEVLERNAHFGLGVVPLDLERDGDVDLYVANDSVVNHFLRNDGTGRLEDLGLEMGAALSGDGQAQAGMGVDAGDIDGDDDADLFVTNFSHDTNTLYTNTDGVVFLDDTHARGLARASLPKLGWATKMTDLDSDGDLDLMVINGHVFPQVETHDLGTDYRQPPQIFRNPGSGRFVEVGGWLDGADPPPWSGRGAAFGDFDNDGDVDVFVVQNDDVGILLRNDTPDHRWLGVRLVGRKGNRDALGARVTFVLDDGTRRVRWCRTGGSYLSANDPRVRVGLGADARVDEVEIAWPSGGVERIERPAAGRWHLVSEGRGLVTSGPAWRDTPEMEPAR